MHCRLLFLQIIISYTILFIHFHIFNPESQSDIKTNNFAFLGFLFGEKFVMLLSGFDFISVAKHQKIFSIISNSSLRRTWFLEWKSLLFIYSKGVRFSRSLVKAVVHKSSRVTPLRIQQSWSVPRVVVSSSGKGQLGVGCMKGPVWWYRY